MQSSLHPSPPPEQGTGAGAEGKGAEWNRAQGDTVGLEEMLLCSSLVLHLLEEFVGGILVAVLLHLGQVTLLWCHSCIHLWTGGGEGGVTKRQTVFELRA